MSDHKRPLSLNGFTENTLPKSNGMNSNMLNNSQLLPPVCEDSADDVNYIIKNLSCPADNVPTYVSKQYNNDSIVGNEIQAYAKIAGCNWTYYVKSLSITLGRNTDIHSSKNTEIIDIDLGPSKVISRKHASIEYDLNGRKWQLFIRGRNGLKVNGVRLNLPSTTPYDLTSGNIIDIGGTQMMFILPDAPPVIPTQFRHLLNNKRQKLNDVESNQISGYGNSMDLNVKSDIINNQVKAFQLQEGVSHPDSLSSEQDYSKDEAKDLKPPYSYATMITQAILSNPQGILSLSEIYDWISNHFAYYRHTKQGWQNSIRHNLSLNKAFEKVPRRPNEPGKGMKWQISESYRKEFLEKWKDGSLNKIRRGTSVSRQLQLHLIKNNVLPSGRERQLPVYASNGSGILLNDSNLINLSSSNMSMSNHNNNLNMHVDMSNSPGKTINNHQGSNLTGLTSPTKVNNAANVGNLNVPPTSSYPLPNLSNNKVMNNDMNFLGDNSNSNANSNSNSNLPSPVKNSSIPEITYMNADQKYSTGLVSSINNTNNSDQLLNNDTVLKNISNENSNDKIVPKIENNNDNDNEHKSKLSTQEHNNENNKTDDKEIPDTNSKSVSDDLVRNTLPIPNPKPQFLNPPENNLPMLSPKKYFSRLEMMTPERNIQRPVLEPNSLHSNGSVNSSPALWNYVQFSTPLGPNTGNSNIPTTGNDGDKLPKIELESPLKNRKTLGKVCDFKDIDLVKGFKQ